ncbi:hypothetical protein GALMADRAFT_56755 [Galerina marginata CBS 339.88]|uniref:Tetraspanin Tsp2 n=1 Tax=Galerina marginata (strain CBS 339.88) TaxID=685588 RepID=A0A067TJR2_GALM3|nr:hypothetical protein GALMADRAFT_56755 [Galerina marginata CBS 339.88]
MKYFAAFPFDSKGSDIGRLGLTGAPALEEGRLSLSYLSRWTGFKWCLFFSVMSVFVCGCAGLISALMTWFNAWDKANVMSVADKDILVLVTLSGCALLLTSFIGITGTLLNSRPLLAMYTILLWPAFLSLLSIGYTSYRRSHHTLDSKLSYAWSRYYMAMGRQLVQDSLQCCGYFSSMHEASPSKRCYLRTPLPGCKDGLFAFERDNLKTIWKAAFSVAPLHLLNIIVAIICANHSTNLFGKRILPKQYRLSPHDVKADAEKLVGVAFVDPSSPGLFAGGKALMIEKSD